MKSDQLQTLRYISRRDTFCDKCSWSLAKLVRLLVEMVAIELGLSCFPVLQGVVFQDMLEDTMGKSVAEVAVEELEKGGGEPYSPCSTA